LRAARNKGGFGPNSSSAKERRSKMKTLLVAIVFAAIAVFGLAWGVSPHVASAQETVEAGDEVTEGEADEAAAAAECYVIWVDINPGPGKRCRRFDCCEPGCDIIDPTCTDS
jgi:hypothetical protein